MTRFSRIVFSALAVSLLAAPAFADNDLGSTSLNFEYQPQAHETIDTPRSETVSDVYFGLLQDEMTDEAEPMTLRAAPQRYGSRGSDYLGVIGGWAIDTKTSDNLQYQLGIAYSYFFEDNLSVELELQGMYFDQGEGNEDRPWGANFNLLIRWHFYVEETWSLFIDGGAGMLYTTDDVPFDGSSFNFTPQAGFGVTFDACSCLGGWAQDARMMLGVRWHHISNASTYDENPGRDSVLLHFGLTWPY